MSIEDLKNALPDYAKDLKQNLGAVLTAPGLTPQQIWGTAVASAIASRNATVLNAVLADATPNLSPEALTAAKAAAAIMGMTNVYYRFLHLTTVPDYAAMPARLRMNVIGNPGVDKVDFELWSLAVSAINGCDLCVDTHEKEIVKHGTGRDVVQNVVRIASVIHAVAVTIETEAAIAG